MRLAISLALLLAAATAPRQGCGNGSAPPAYDPCADKACGAPCTVCPPGATDCVETAVVKACDPFHGCVPAFEGMCTPQGECSGKACGTPCAWPDLPCLSAIPPCLPPVGPGYCDASGACAQGYPPPPGACPLPPSWGCVGKACGDGCGYCPPGTDPASCPVPTFAPTACDAQLQCVSASTVTCSLQAACQGKTCGAACETCPAWVRPRCTATPRARARSASRPARPDAHPRPSKAPRRAELAANAVAIACGRGTASPPGRERLRALGAHHFDATAMVTELLPALVSPCGAARLAVAVFVIGWGVAGAFTAIAIVACAPFGRSPSAHETVCPPVHEPAVVVTPTYASEAGSASENDTGILTRSVHMILNAEERRSA